MTAAKMESGSPATVSSNERLTQIRRSHAAARPKHDNPAWLHTHNDLTFVLDEIERLRGIIKQAIAGHEVWESIYGSSPTSRAHYAVLVAGLNGHETTAPW
jgi:hypothetical protein